ncbi:hypothetical protein PFISCL1PPCAC_27038, partial [Pristionchus fissidentatus]
PIPPSSFFWMLYLLLMPSLIFSLSCSILRCFSFRLSSCSRRAATTCGSSPVSVFSPSFSPPPVSWSRPPDISFNFPPTICFITNEAILRERPRGERERVER